MKERAVFENLLNEYQKTFLDCDSIAREAYNGGQTAVYHKNHREALKAMAARDALERAAKSCDLKVYFNALTGFYTVERH